MRLNGGRSRQFLCTVHLNAGREGDKKRKWCETFDKVYFENLENQKNSGPEGAL